MCCWYEKLAAARDEFMRLRSYRELRGISLQILGHGATELTGIDADSFYGDYIREDAVFSHENALAALLLAANGELTELPWRRYMRLNPDLYARFDLPEPVTWTQWH
jgi:hypothetical protein